MRKLSLGSEHTHKPDSRDEREKQTACDASFKNYLIFSDAMNLIYIYIYTHKP